jgi:DNA mismatch repair protein MutS
MSFFADKQTVQDLNIPGRHRHHSVANLFDAAVTAGGRKLLDAMFEQPLEDFEAINARSSIFSYFAGLNVVFPISGEEYDITESYLSSGYGASLSAVAVSVISKKVLQVAARDRGYGQLNAQVCKTISLLSKLSAFVNKLPADGSPYREQLDRIKKICNHPQLKSLHNDVGAQSLPPLKLIRYDYLLRTVLHGQFNELTAMITLLDVYIAVSAVGKRKGFCYAKALPKTSNAFRVTGLYHPAVEHAVGNDLRLGYDSNVLFLTGANMAGKSTLMKSFGICLYLAHMGFPIAAGQLEFSVRDGLYSSINVPDNLNMGYSHFYAEVLRVKAVAEAVAADKDLVVIFDELFKGTNVKDAYDATLAITEAFSENRNCFFMISTHIIEVGEALKKHGDNFRFAYLPTIMEGIKPRYTYRLTDGITTDRHGMMIIENEGILEIIKTGGSKTKGQ